MKVNFKNNVTSLEGHCETTCPLKYCEKEKLMKKKSSTNEIVDKGKMKLTILTL